MPRTVDPLRFDPTRTTLIRQRYAAELVRRLNLLKIDINRLLIEEDVFGYKAGDTPALHTRWIFQTVANKIAGFRDWLTTQINSRFLSTDIDGKPWNAKYIESAYRKGIVKAYTQVHDLEPSQKSFLESSFNAPVRTSKLQLLLTRAYEDLKGFTSRMASNMGRVLADSMAAGKDIRTTAKNITEQVDIEKSRAKTIARTEIIHAHAEGQLDAFKEAGVAKVHLLAEWITAAGEGASVAEMKAAGVCPKCQAKSGEVMTIDEARGMIPLHPNCRCAWLPAMEGW
jgi:SPP1 gp7 family putative phage head morphogenesis protein